MAIAAIGIALQDRQRLGAFAAQPHLLRLALSVGGAMDSVLIEIGHIVRRSEISRTVGITHPLPSSHALRRRGQRAGQK
ncbi:MAG: hypothetical protein WDM89_13680 [Rhizomicrobium sp.]